MTASSVSLEKTISREKGKLFSFIRKNVSSKEDAEDILQEVLYQLVSGFEDIEFIERISAWLMKVARNKIIDLYRKKKTSSFSDEQVFIPSDDSDEPLTLEEILPDLSHLPDEIYWQSAIREEIDEALDELPPDQKEIFIMNEFNGISFKEISELKGININTLLSKKRYAILFLRKRLKNLYEELKNV